MSAKRMTTWAVVMASLLSWAVQTPIAFAGPIGLVDDFSGNLAAWTDTRILNNGSHSPTNTHAWQITGGVLELSTTADVGIEQYAFTRTDFSLSVGEELQGDFKAGFTGTQDIGLYVGAGTRRGGRVRELRQRSTSATTGRFSVAALMAQRNLHWAGEQRRPTSVPCSQCIP